MIKKVCFNGCSFTVGEGFDPDLRDQYIYDRLISRQCGFDRTNIAKGGSSNHEIFMRSVRALDQGFDMMFVQWSALNRIWFYPGPDCEWSSNDDNDEFRYREIYLDKHTQQKFRNTLLMMNHDYHGLISLVDYCNILTVLAEKYRTKIIFINGLVPWTNDLVAPLQSDLDSSLSYYTKEILDFDHRDDDQIREFFVALQTKVKSLDQRFWVNIFDSFRKNTVDHGPQGHHPGIRSHRNMADRIMLYLNQNNLV